MLYDKILKPILFRIDPETAHETVATLLSLTQHLPWGPDLLSLTAGRPGKGLATEFLGMQFPNPIGLAAGFDKDCRMRVESYRQPL